MRAYLITSISLLFLPVAAFAQTDYMEQSIIFTAPLAIAGLIGLLSSLLVFRNASKIGSGTLHNVYRFFAFGILLISCGVLVRLVPTTLLSFSLEKMDGIFFIIGFATMGVGANKILEAAGLK